MATSPSNTSPLGSSIGGGACGGDCWKLSHFKPDTCVAFAVLLADALRADAATGRGPGGQDCRSAVRGRHGAAVDGDFLNSPSPCPRMGTGRRTGRTGLWEAECGMYPSTAAS